MMINAEETAIKGCFILYPKVFKDLRGSFVETFNKAALEQIVGYSVNFVQDNQSVSRKNVLRGLHYQAGEHAQAKLIRVLQGRVRDVILDLRRDSPSFGKHASFELSGDDGAMIFIPKGMAHGFLSLEDQTVFSYKCDAYYNPLSESGINYKDPDLGINWGVDPSHLVLSEKDRQLPLFKELFP